MKTRPLAVAAGACIFLLTACGGGGGGGSAPSGDFTVAVDTSTTAANDLRGLSFASSGKVYASGHSDAVAGDRRTVVMRFNADGTPDTAFGGDGAVELNLAMGGDEQSFGIVELANGDVVVLVNAADGIGGAVITSTENPAVSAPRQDGISARLVRLSSSGNLVNSFGTNGVVEVPFGWANSDNNQWPVPTLNAAGTFSNAGFPRDTGWDLQLDTSAAAERLVVFGLGPAPLSTAGTQRLDQDRYVARLLASTGAIDPAFNGGASFSWNSPGSLGDNTRRGNVESDGDILSVGYTNLGTGLNNHVVLLRLTSAGVLDTSFPGFGLTPAQPGVAVFNPFLTDGGFAEAYAASRQSDGTYVTTGYGGATGAATASTLGYRTTLAQDLVTFRVAGGTLDTTYGNSGTQAIQSEGQGRPTNEERGRDMEVLPDDRTVQVGRYGGNTAIYVLTPDGQLDTRADGDGIFELSHPTITAQFFASALSADGRRIAATTNADAAGARLVILESDD